MLSPDAGRVPDDTLAPGARIGAWRIVHELGRGGMGAVYRAERDDAEFRQQAAIKVVKRGMDTDDILRRFRNERRILAALGHPHIARLLDGGSLPDGRPYFVMELVEGLPIVEYCQAHELSIEDRLRLFLDVCAAVHFAHQNLVVHRDLKPGNVLVTAGGAAKLLDFGIAKLVDPSDETAATMTDFRLMTPEYASPEQIRGEPITTSTDVYALGVVLYELLTGRRPYKFTSRHHAEMARVVCEEMPPRPSAVVGTAPAAEAGISPAGAGVARAADSDPTTPAWDDTRASARSGHASSVERRVRPLPLPPHRLRRRLEGDLDTIVLKAMAREPARRYSSVEQFADDVRRHLAGRPVLARPDTLGYRLATFARRNRIAVVAGVVVLASVVAGVVAVAWQARIARAERARAVASLADVRALANAFIFEVHDAIAPLPGSTAARQLLVTRALQYLDRLAAAPDSSAEQLEELAAGYQRLGDVQGRRQTANLGDTTGALASHRKALALRERVAAMRPDDARARVQLALSEARVGEMLVTAGDTAGAAESLQRAVTVLEPAAAAHPDDLDIARQLAQAHDRLAYTVAARGDAKAALARYELARDIMRKVAARQPDDLEAQRMFAAGDQRIGNTLGNPNFPNLGDTVRATASLNDAVARLARLSEANPDDVPTRRTLAVAHGNLADVMRARGDLSGSLAGNRRALALFQRILDADPRNVQAMRDVALSYSKTAELQAAMGDIDAAVADAQVALARFEALADADASNATAQADVASSLSVIGDLLLKKGDTQGALVRFERMTTIVEQLAAKDAANSESQYAVAIAYSQMGEAWAARGGRAALARARDYFAKSAGHFADLKDKGALTGSDAEQPERIATEIARLDRRLKP